MALARLVPWEAFRARLQAALTEHGLRTAAGERKSSAGRKPWDEVVIFKALVLQALYNLSDEQAEYQLRDRLSFMRFLGLGLEDAVPDATTFWLYREALAKAGAVEAAVRSFDGFLKNKGYLARGGQIIDATIVSAPKQRNSREDNETIKAGKTPEDWKAKPAKNRQKDKDARWTKKHERTFLWLQEPHRRGPPAQVRAPLRGCTDASVHDSQKFDDVLDASNTASDVWADSAYRCAEIEEKLAERGLKSRIHRAAARNRPLSRRRRRPPIRRARRCAPASSMYSVIRRTRWERKIVRTIGMAVRCAR